MAESPEHKFLSEYFLEILKSFSRMNLYGYTEADRRKYDFACVLQKDWGRPLIGQTLWKHTEGIDKDIRTMLTEKEANIWAYVARDTIANRATLNEIIQDYKNTEARKDLFKLKIFWIPQDFDADKIDSQRVVKESLGDAVVNDILMNVVFGNLSSNDIRYFLNDSGIMGLNFAVLHEVAINGFVNYPALKKSLGVSSGPLREKMLLLTGSGFLWQLKNGSMYHVTLKGRVFLQLINRLFSEIAIESSPELLLILSKLGLRIGEFKYEFDQDYTPEWTPEMTFRMLINCVESARNAWGIELGNENFKIHPFEINEHVRIYR